MENILSYKQLINRFYTKKKKKKMWDLLFLTLQSIKTTLEL